MEEIWKDITGYEGLYQVSDLGRVKSLAKTVQRDYRGPVRRKEKIIAPSTTWGGYMIITLCHDKVKNTFLVSRLVAIQFIPNPDNKATVNHKFGDKRDNRAVALEWMTKAENIQHAYRTGLKVSLPGADAGNAKPVMDTTTGLEYGCIADALMARNIPRSTYMTRRNRNGDNMGIIIK